MIWLLLSILCSTFIFIIFKLYERFGIRNLPAIVVNYLAAWLVGILVEGGITPPSEIISEDWFSSVLILGFLFIILFQVMAYVAQKIGVSVVSVSVKMSLVIPVSFAMFYYDEPINITKAVGIVLALAAVYLSSRKDEKIRLEPALAWLPLLLFFASGFMDSFLKYNQQELVSAAEHAIFTTSLFGMAGLFGIIFLIIQAVRSSEFMNWRDVIGGLFLGIPNYGSIYFLLRALDSEGLQSSVVFPVNNVGIVLLSTICGLLLFREKLNALNVTGIILAVIAIVLVSFQNFMNV